MSISVLIFGGTGAIGKPLIDCLPDKYEIYVTSRSKRESSGRIHYIQGNAHDETFLTNLFSNSSFDYLVDFMSYTTGEFSKLYPIFSDKVKQYIFISSARVYSETSGFITEETPRLLNSCTDEKYVMTDEYALRKAREEDILINSGRKNWTIVRPSITYNDFRLQMPIGEKEEWLYRALKGRSIVFPKQLAGIKTTMTYGGDVAYAISRLVGNSDALGQIFHIAGASAITWSEVLEVYVSTIKNKLGISVNVVYSDDIDVISKQLDRFYQVKYARSINREFDNSKLLSVIGPIDFVQAKEGLSKCLSDFIDNGCKFKYVSWKAEAVFDRICHEHTKLGEFSSLKTKLGYLVARYTPFLAYKNQNYI